jgi:hypothetical protein
MEEDISYLNVETQAFDTYIDETKIALNKGANDVADISSNLSTLVTSVSSAKEKLGGLKKVSVGVSIDAQESNSQLVDKLQREYEEKVIAVLSRLNYYRNQVDVYNQTGQIPKSFEELSAQEQEEFYSNYNFVNDISGFDALAFITGAQAQKVGKDLSEALMQGGKAATIGTYEMLLKQALSSLPDLLKTNPSWAVWQAAGTGTLIVTAFDFLIKECFDTRHTVDDDIEAAFEAFGAGLSFVEWALLSSSTTGGSGFVVFLAVYGTKQLFSFLGKVATGNYEHYTIKRVDPEDPSNPDKVKYYPVPINGTGKDGDWEALYEEAKKSYRVPKNVGATNYQNDFEQYWDKEFLDEYPDYDTFTDPLTGEVNDTFNQCYKNVINDILAKSLTYDSAEEAEAYFNSIDIREDAYNFGLQYGYYVEPEDVLTIIYTLKKQFQFDPTTYYNAKHGEVNL